ncbi:KUP system potassium uptake protein [Devosia sp. UYZn731]|uniref:potassium transporter Kup n=1 Tax=Devosia sp. UYZn731 TaxID=3156345 RepID=UPI003397A2A7
MADFRDDDPELPAPPHAGHFPALVMGALGVVYGDIGTSPLYAFREALHAAGGSEAVTGPEVLGLLSLIVWALTIIVTVKYVGFVLRADNKGEGGTLSLMTLARNSIAGRPLWVLVLGIIGASLFFGDAIITPAISVLSAVEGLEVVTPRFTDWVVPITLTIIVALFLVQRFGTGKVASIFGPVTALWFIVLGISGLVHIFNAPGILAAINPYYAVQFLASHGGLTLVVLGAVFLAVTGAEALYVDLGHFGRKPIVFAWFALVFPCLLLNYFGQGAFVLAHEGAVDHPFFEMQPDWARLPMVILAAAATVIASQAVISGAYSLTRQAMHLNLLPRFSVTHTSKTQSGQIYMPGVNTLLLIAVIILVLVFQSSSALSAAYGIAVTGEMLITAVLLFVVMRNIWKWQIGAALLLIIPLVIVDTGFFIANLAKFAQGGWVPAVVAATLAFIMQTWIGGRKLLLRRTKAQSLPLNSVLDSIASKKLHTIKGTAIYLTSEIEGAPVALLHCIKHFETLHEQNIVLSVLTATTPHVADDERVKIEPINDRFTRLVLTFGYMETPNLPKALIKAQTAGLSLDVSSTTFFVSKRTLKPTRRGGMPFWQDRLFIALANSASNATEYFALPTGRVVELGTQVSV